MSKSLFNYHALTGKCIFLLSFVISTSCTKDKTLINEFNTKVNALSLFNQPEETSTPVEIDSAKAIRNPDDDVQECVVRTYKAAPGFNEMITLDPTTDVIFPGALLDGASVTTGEYKPISVNRAPIALSASLTNISGSPVIKIEDPKLSTVREGIKSLLDQEVTGSTVASVNFEIKQVFSEEQINVAIGANYKSAGQKVSTAFNFNSNTKKNKFLLKYIQKYYTIDMDPPSLPSDLFTTLPDFESLGATSPVYVASVAYGRMVIYTIETDKSETEVNAAFNASFSSGGVAIDGKHKKTFESSTIKALIVGGDGGGAAQAINSPQDVYKFISTGGNYSKDSPGAPLSYKLRYIKKGTPVARLVLSSEYPIRTCYEAYQKFGIEIYGFNCVNNDNETGRVEIFGSMSAGLYQNKKRIKNVSWSRSKSNFVGVDENKFYGIKKGIEVEVYKPDLDKDYINLYAKFSEKDIKNDDYFGAVHRKILLKNVKEKKKEKQNYVRINLEDDYGSDMRAYFYVWRID
ncbi:thiol-activated cytolysin family protein [Ascidiimonas sp. W6]|uniref:thiol-activated cytolysin family protein n=1 Tax=Ascidiimonas meishanensis TaxID=3128903 RepID=UPI0030EB3107